jgi:hypothetical protein
MTTAVNEQPAAQRTRQAHPAAGLPRLLPAARTPEPLRAHLARLGPVPYRDRGNRTDRTDNRTDRTDNRTDRTDRADNRNRPNRPKHPARLADRRR